MPTVSFTLEAMLPGTVASGGVVGLDLSSFQVVSSESDPAPSTCATYLSPVQNVPGSIQTQYFEGGEASDGTHWMSVENWTPAAGGPSMGRFQSDVVPVGAMLHLSRTMAEDGQAVAATVTASGGVAPYTCAWTLGGAALPNTTCSA